jgi:RNA polymerase sigma-70 factor (ECF subfamily)
VLNFRELYERHYGDVYRFALFLTSDPARAEDLAADTFVRAWTARDRIRQPTVRAYLLTITRNLHRDAMRQRKAFVPLNDTVPDERPGIDVQVQTSSMLQAMRARLRQIARADRHALLLYVVRDMSYADIAKTLGISVGAVKSRIFRAREALASPPVASPKGDPDESHT